MLGAFVGGAGHRGAEGDGEDGGVEGFGTGEILYGDLVPAEGTVLEMLERVKSSGWGKMACLGSRRSRHVEDCCRVGWAVRVVWLESHGGLRGSRVVVLKALLSVI